MKAEIRDNQLHIAIPLLTPPEPSKTGKTHLVANTRGAVRTAATIDGQPVVVNVIAWIKPAEPSE